MAVSQDYMATLLEAPLTPEEQEMLKQFVGINSLVSHDEALALFRMALLLPRQSRLLEIGSFRGGSTVALGHAARLRQHAIYCVDVWAEYQQQSDFVNMDSSQLHDMTILQEFISNTRFIKDRLCMLRGNSTDFRDILAEDLFSMVFIDGAHDYDSVVDDIIFGLKVIRPGGILCGHDYHSRGMDVKKAVHDIIINAEALTVKGVIRDTSIWYVVVEDPEYERLVAGTLRLMSKKDFAAAYRMLTDGLGSVKETEEIIRIRSGLEGVLDGTVMSEFADTLLPTDEAVR